MNPLLVALMAVDELHGGRRMHELAHGWMGWESKRGRALRTLGARGLRSLATRLAQADPPQPLGDPATLEAAR